MGAKTDLSLMAIAGGFGAKQPDPNKTGVEHLRSLAVPVGSYQPVSAGRPDLGGGIVSSIGDALSDADRFLSKSAIYDSIKRAVTAPGRAWKGEIDVNTPEGMEEATNLAMSVGTGGLATTAARPIPRGSLGTAAYHGSPHKFDKFDMSKIGTGEGAQAYGHGLYFAENPGVAKSYMSNKSKSYTAPKLSDYNGDRQLLEKANEVFNAQRMSDLESELNKYGISLESTSVSGGRPFSYTNAIGGKSMYGYVPGLGEVRFSDHLRSGGMNSTTYNTPHDVINALREKYINRINTGKAYSEIRQELGLENVSDKSNLRKIQDFLKQNPQTGQAKDPGYWARKAGLDTTKPGGWGFEKTISMDDVPKGLLDQQNSLYEVSLRWPDAAREASDPLGPQHFLDWDKPLSEQPSNVQPVLRDMLEKARKSFSGIDPQGNPIAGQAHHLYAMHRGNNAATVAEELKAAGIPGIRYLDQKSRSNFMVQNTVKGKPYGEPVSFMTERQAQDYAAEQIEKGFGTEIIPGTSNFVLFDDQLPRILERNEVPTGLQPWKPGEFAAKSGRFGEKAPVLSVARKTFIKNAQHAQNVSDDIYNLANASGLDVAFERSPAWGSQYMTITHPDGRVLRVRVADHANRYGGNDVYIDPSSASVEEGVSAIRQAFPELLAKMPAGQGKKFLAERAKATQDAEMFMLKNAKGTQPAELYPLVNKIGEAKSRAEISRLRNELETLLSPTRE